MKEQGTPDLLERPGMFSGWPGLQVVKHGVLVSALVCHSCSPTRGSNTMRPYRWRTAESRCITDVSIGKHDQDESVKVRLRMLFYSHFFPAITLLSPNPSPTPSLLQDCTYPANSLVIPWLPFPPFSISSPSKWTQAYSCWEEHEEWEFSEEQSLLFSSTTLLYASCVSEEMGECKVICRCAKQLQW